MATQEIHEVMNIGCLQHPINEALADEGFGCFQVYFCLKEAIGQDVNSSRGIWGGVNGTEVDLNLLRANRLYGDLDGCAQVEELILENERRKSWLIFYSHDVRETPSPFGCTPALLEFAVSFAAQRGGRVRTVTDVVHELGKQRER